MSSLDEETELRDYLVSNNGEFRRLMAEHKAHATQLEQLNGRHHLSEDERIREITLKKKKLLLKDQMHAILQRHRRELRAES